MAKGVPPRRGPKEQRPDPRQKPSGHRPIKPPTRRGLPGKPPSEEPLRVILDADAAPSAPTQMMARDRMVLGKPAKPPASRAEPPPRRIPLTKEQQTVGKILVAEGPITSDMVRRQIEEHGLQNSLLAKAVAASGHAPETELMTLLLTGYRIPKVKLANYRVPQEALGLVPAPLARKHKVVPLGKIGSVICVAVGSIFDLQVGVVEEIRRETGCLVKVFQSTAADVDAAVKRFYPAPRKREVVTAARVAPDVVESVSSESMPYEDTAEHWEELYASAGPLKAIRIEDL